MSGLGLTLRRRRGQAQPIAGSDYILSENRGDPEVFRILMSKGVSSDGVGITRDDAARVTSIDTWFYQNKTIKSFDELQYFTGITKLVKNAFAECTALKSITLPSSCVQLEAQAIIDSGVEKINLDEVTALGDYAISRCNIRTFSAPNLLTMGVGQLHACPYLEEVSSMGEIPFIDGGRGAYNLTTLYECPNLQEVVIPDSVTYVQGAYILGNCSGLKKIVVSANMTAMNACQYFAHINQGATAVHLDLIMRGETPPTINNNFLFRRTGLTIYVPDNAVDAYKAAWSSKASYIKPLSEYQG